MSNLDFILRLLAEEIASRRLSSVDPLVATSGSRVALRCLIYCPGEPVALRRGLKCQPQGYPFVWMVF